MIPEVIVVTGWKFALAFRKWILYPPACNKHYIFLHTQLCLYPGIISHGRRFHLSIMVNSIVSAGLAMPGLSDYGIDPIRQEYSDQSDLMPLSERWTCLRPRSYLMLSQSRCPGSEPFAANYVNFYRTSTWYLHSMSASFVMNKNMFPTNRIHVA